MKKIKFKKYFFGIAFIFFLCNIFGTSVKAASANIWTVDGKSLHLGQSNALGSVKWISDNNYPNGVLVLDNYVGGQIKIDCYGTGNGGIFAVKLVGDNKITVKDGIGVVAGEPIVFIGDGTLTIESQIPISGGYYLESVDVNEFDTTTVVIKPSVKEIECQDNNNNSNATDNNEENEIDDNTNVNNEPVKDNSSDNDKLNIILLSCVGVNIIVFLLLVIKLIKNTKKTIS